MKDYTNMTFGSLIMPDKARKSAAALYQFCCQTGCLYCPFWAHDTEVCMLEHRPRNYPMIDIMDGGNGNAK